MSVAAELSQQDEIRELKERLEEARRIFEEMTLVSGGGSNSTARRLKWLARHGLRVTNGYRGPREEEPA